jgi:hypothetical protein
VFITYYRTELVSNLMGSVDCPPGHDKNRLLTHFYGILYFADPAEERLVKRFARDRMKYLDEIFCGGGRVVQKLVKYYFSH